MNFLKKIISRFQKHEDLYQIAEYLADEFSKLRNDWYNNCLKFIEQNLIKDGTNINITLKPLGGIADLSIKAYQIYLTSYFIKKNNYVPEKLYQSFILLLGILVTGDESLSNIIEKYDIYDKGDYLRQVGELTGSISEYLVGHPDSLIMVSITPFVKELIVTNQAIVADAFGDIQTVKKILISTKKYYSSKQIQIETND
jgi:hypothetical protein